jgi:hypothetical protein
VLSCLFSFLCGCLHFNVEHDDLVGRCRAITLAGDRCPCEAFVHTHDDICLGPPEVIV